MRNFIFREQMTVPTLYRNFIPHVSLLIVGVLLAYPHSAHASQETPASPIVVGKPGTIPSKKDVAVSIFKISSIPLSADKSCANVGTDFGDTTIGDYLGGFLTHMGGLNDGNHVIIEIEPDTTRAHRATFYLAQSVGETVWRWGVRFNISPLTNIIDISSIQCVGAG